MPHASPPAVAAVHAGQGFVHFVPGVARTIVAGVRAEAPLKLLGPQNHGHAAWVFAATFGGGLVEGDEIRVALDVAPDATALYGTQASTKVYRCPTRTSRQDLEARVGEGGLLVVLPDPVVCFAEARYEQRITVDLAATGSLVLVDAFTAGRSARGERWDFARYASHVEVTREGAPVLFDAIVLDPAHGELRRRMGRFDAFATIVTCGPRAAALVSAASTEPPVRSAAFVESQSPLGDDGVVYRVAGTAVELVTRAVRAKLSALGAVLGDDPFARKW